MTPPQVFLETSLQTHRVLINNDQLAHVERHIRSLAPNVYSSNYVWMEYQRTVLADYAHIQRLLIVHRSWGKVIAQLLVGRSSNLPP